MSEQSEDSFREQVFPFHKVLKSYNLYVHFYISIVSICTDNIQTQWQTGTDLLKLMRTFTDCVQISPYVELYFIGGPYNIKVHMNMHHNNINSNIWIHSDQFNIIIYS